MISFKGKVVAVTGGASGMGLATVKLVASLGAKVSVADRNQKGLESAAEAVKAAGHGEIMTMTVDVRNKDQVNHWISETVKWGGKLNCAVNMAGDVEDCFRIKTVAEIEDEEWDYVMDVNLKGVMHCLRAELNAISDNGSIVSAASLLGVQGQAKSAAYSASKHGVIGLTRSAAKEFGHRGIRINCIAPGVIDTPLLNATAEKVKASEEENSSFVFDTAIARMGTPEEAANLIAFLISDAASFITGNVASVDGGWNC